MRYGKSKSDWSVEKGDRKKMKEGRRVKINMKVSGGEFMHSRYP